MMIDDGNARGTKKVSATITFALYVKLFMAGMGRHIYCLRSEQILDLQKWALLSQIGVSITLGLMKISVCLFVLRVVDKARKGIAKALWLLIYFVALTHILQVIMYVIQCRPLAALWNRKVKGQCFSTHIVYMVAYLNYGKIFYPFPPTPFNKFVSEADEKRNKK